MTNELPRCCVVVLIAAWLLVPAAQADEAKVAAKPAQAVPAAPQRVSPFAKYARAHAEAQKSAASTRVSILTLQRHHRTLSRPAQ